MHVNNCPGDLNHQPGVAWRITLVPVPTVFTCLMQTLYKSLLLKVAQVNGQSG